MKFSRPIISIQWIQWIPRKTPRSPIQCVRTMVGRGFDREKSKDPPFEKAGKSPKTKSHGQVARRLSKFDTRLAEVRWKNGSRRMFHCRSSTAADRRSKISSPFMRLRRHPWNLVETPLASGTVRFRSSIKETSDSWETCACEIFHLENLPFFSHRF